MGLFGWGKKSAREAATVAVQQASLARLLKARYDAATTTDLNRNHWAMSDGNAANVALSPMNRRTMRNRARYEAGNNGYLAGMVSTLASDAVGTGPTLLLDCGPDANQDSVARVEDNVYEWHQRIDLARKLRVMRSAKAIDGESFAIQITNQRLRGVQLDVRVVEAEMIADPTAYWDWNANVDGIKFDAAGNPAFYHLLKNHPGSAQFDGNAAGTWVSADKVCHYFHATRPQQSRGVGEVVPALELFAMLRRYQYAVVTAAETAADLALILESQLVPESTVTTLPNWDTMPYARGMAMNLPAGWNAKQMKAEHPTSTFDAFERRVLMQISRSLNMPYIVAVMDATGANYSTMRGDYLVYRKHVSVERADIERVVLDPLMEAWIEEAAVVPGAIPDGLPPRDQWTWRWRWDGFEHVDPLKEAAAEEVAIANKTISRSEACSRRGKDWRQVFRQIAAEEAYAMELGIDLDGDSSQMSADPSDDGEDA